MRKQFKIPDLADRNFLYYRCPEHYECSGHYEDRIVSIDEDSNGDVNFMNELKKKKCLFLQKWLQKKWTGKIGYWNDAFTKAEVISFFA